jgi:hypothetical protein
MHFFAVLGVLFTLRAIVGLAATTLAEWVAVREGEAEGLFYPAHFQLRDGEIHVTDAYVAHVLTAPDREPVR